jgi:hypothetical protein
VILLLLALSGCGGQAQQITSSEPVVYQLASPANVRSDFVTYSDSNYPFIVELPRSWFAGELTTGPAYGIVATNTNQPGEPRAAISIVAEPIEAGATVEQAVTAAEDALRQQNVTDFRVELDRQATVNQNPGRERSYRFVSDGQNVRQRTIYVMGTDNLYAISLTAPQDIFAQHEAIFNDVLITFEGF